MLLQSYKFPKPFKGPQLPQELWDIINKFVQQIEAYEKTLTNKELYDLRIRQGWTVPKEQQGNWIERNYQKKWDTLDGPSRIKWYLGLGDNKLQFKNWDSKRTTAGQLAIRGSTKPSPKKTKRKINLNKKNLSKDFSSYKTKSKISVTDLNEKNVVRKMMETYRKNQERAKSLTNFNKNKSPNNRAKTV